MHHESACNAGRRRPNREPRSGIECHRKHHHGCQRCGPLPLRTPPHGGRFYRRIRGRRSSLNRCNLRSNNLRLFLYVRFRIRLKSAGRLEPLVQFRRIGIDRCLRRSQAPDGQAARDSLPQRLTVRSALPRWDAMSFHPTSRGAASTFSLESGRLGSENGMECTCIRLAALFVTLQTQRVTWRSDILAP